MPLKIELQDAMKDAMRAKDKLRLTTVRSILAAVKQFEVDERVEPTDDQILAILNKLAKQRRDSISQFEAAERQDLADTEKAELAIIQTFLPAALSEAEITEAVEAAIAETGANSMAQMGAVMNILRPKLTGRADLSVVSQLVKQKLTA